MEVPCTLGSELATFAEAVLGEPVRAARELPPGRCTGVVWRIEFVGGAVFVLKAHRSRTKHERERRAYQAWLPSLVPYAPRLLGARPTHPRALLLEMLPGEAGIAPTDPPALAVHRQAGAWLGRLHSLPCLGEDLWTLHRAYTRRVEAWTARARLYLPVAQMDRARAHLQAWLPRLHGRTRVPCHRDYAPYNWLTAHGRLRGVIDFEHARPDLPETDLARLAAHVWPKRPALRDAFLDGYREMGGPAATAPADLLGPVLLEAVATLAWACAHQDRRLEAAGRRALARLLGEGL